MSSETRIRLIETAERLFAERGVLGVSLREIGAEAGQRNTGAVRYHFGTAEQLVSAVFEHRMAPINEHRMAMIAQLDVTGRGDDPRGLTEAFLYPLAEMLGEPGKPSWYLRFCLHAAYVEDSPAMHLDAHPWTRGVAIIADRVVRRLAGEGVPPVLREERWSFFSGFLTHALADRELLIQTAPQRIRTPRSAFLADLADSGVAMVGAPVSTSTAQQLRHRRSA